MMLSRIKIIADHYGKENQTIKAIEELGELTQVLAEAITKKPDIPHITEECADVFIMLKQIMHLYGISEDDFSKVCYSKLKRQIERIRDEQVD